MTTKEQKGRTVISTVGDHANSGVGGVRIRREEIEAREDHYLLFLSANQNSEQINTNSSCSRCDAL
jgi:hypothetical protein